jgi:hypothetical protein
MRRERQGQRQKLLRTFGFFFPFLMVETSIFLVLFCDLLDRFDAEQKAKALSRLRLCSPLP